MYSQSEMKPYSFIIKNEGKNKIGNGFIISEHGYALTVYHVIKDLNKIIIDDIEIGKEKFMPYPGLQFDVALIKIPSALVDYYQILKIRCEDNFKNGEDLILYGLDADIFAARNLAIVNSERYYESPVTCTKFPCIHVRTKKDNYRLWPGDSGAPLFFPMTNHLAAILCTIADSKKYVTNIGGDDFWYLGGDGNAISISTLITEWAKLKELTDNCKRTVIENIHITTGICCQDCISDVLKDYLNKMHQYDVSFTNIFGRPTSERIECDLHIIIINIALANLEKNKNAIQNLTNEIDNIISPPMYTVVFLKEETDLARFRTNPKGPLQLVIKTLLQKTRVNNNIFNIGVLFSEIKKLLKGNIGEYLQTSGYLDSSSYQNGKIDIIIPEKNNMLYIHSCIPEIMQSNLELRDVLYELFIKNNSISPQWTKKFIKISNKHLEIYIIGLLCELIEEYSKKNYRFIATDYIMCWDVEPVWLYRAFFRKILKTTYSVSNSGLDLSRIYIFNIDDKQNLQDMLEANNRLICKIILLQLSFKNKLYFYRENMIDDILLEGDRNFILLQKKDTTASGNGATSKIAMLDLKFPYLRLFGFNPTELLWFIKKYRFNKATNQKSPLLMNRMQSNYVRYIEESVTHIVDNNGDKRIVEADFQDEMKCLNWPITYHMENTANNYFCPSPDFDNYGKKDCSIVKNFIDILETVGYEIDKPWNFKHLIDFMDSIKFNDALSNIQLKIEEFLFDD